MPFSRESSQHRDGTQDSHIARGFFTVWVTREAQEYWSSLQSESPGKPKNTGVGSLSPLQGIFLNHESNQGLLHCWQTLDQLSYHHSNLCLYQHVSFLSHTVLLCGPWPVFFLCTAACVSLLRTRAILDRKLLHSRMTYLNSSHLLWPHF